MGIQVFILFYGGFERNDCLIRELSSGETFLSGHLIPWRTRDAPDQSSVTYLRDWLILPGFRSLTPILHIPASFCYPSIHLAHMLFNFLLSSRSTLLWVQSVFVLSAALLLSLPVRCHNSFPDSFVLPLWRWESSNRSRNVPFTSAQKYHQKFACRQNMAEDFDPCVAQSSPQFSSPRFVSASPGVLQTLYRCIDSDVWLLNKIIISNLGHTIIFHECECYAVHLCIK